MGIVSTLAGVGGLIREAGGLTRTLRGDRGEEAQAEHMEHMAALAQLGAEFEQARASWFDIAIDGINRLPRPALAIGTLGLFVYAMAEPIGFASRMQGLELVPDQLWWLLGAIVSFYFGARELHYFRERGPGIGLDALKRVTERRAAIDEMAAAEEIETEAGEEAEEIIWPFRPSRKGDPSEPGYNAALEDWRIEVAGR